MPTLYIIAGPNGVGKTTFADSYLPDEAKQVEFVNADLIARGLSPYGPDQLLPLLARPATVPFRFHRGLKQGRLVGVVTQRPPLLLYVPLQQVHVFHRRVASHESREPAAGRIVDHVD